MVEQGRPPEDTLVGYPGHFLTSIIAGHVRQFGHPVVKDTAPPNDPAHGLVLGKKMDSFANAMLRSHQWIVPSAEAIVLSGGTIFAGRHCYRLGPITSQGKEAYDRKGWEPGILTCEQGMLDEVAQNVRPPDLIEGPARLSRGEERD